MTRHELGTVCVQGGWRPKNGEPCQLIGIGKTLLERKLSGVFEHRVVRRSSMLFRGCDDVFRIPHSRHTTIDEEAVRAHPELKVLAESDEAGIFALSTEGGRQIFFTETAAGSLRIHSDGGMRQTSLFRSIWLSPMKGVCLSTPCAKVLP